MALNDFVSLKIQSISDSITFDLKSNTKERVNLLEIKGITGSGKQDVINNITTKYSENNTYILKGSFNQHSLQPYSPYFQLFHSLVTQLIAYPEEKTESWKYVFQQELGGRMSLLTNNIQGFDLVIGTNQKTLLEAVPETQQNINQALQILFKALEKINAKFIIVLEQLEFAKNEELNLLLEIISNNHFKNIKLIYTFSETKLTPPLLELLKEIKRSDLTQKVYELNRYNTEDLNIELSNYFKQTHTVELTEIIYDKTNGLASFVNRFIKTCIDNESIHFDTLQSTWSWDIDKVKKTPTLLSQDETETITEELTIDEQVILFILHLTKIPLSLPVLIEASKLTTIEVENTCKLLLEKKKLYKLSNNEYLVKDDKLGFNVLKKQFKTFDTSLVHISTAKWLAENLREKEAVYHFNKALNKIEDEKILSKAIHLNLSLAETFFLNENFEAVLQLIDSFIDTPLTEKRLTNSQLSNVLAYHTLAVKASLKLNLIQKSLHYSPLLTKYGENENQLYFGTLPQIKLLMEQGKHEEAFENFIGFLPKIGILWNSKKSKSRVSFDLQITRIRLQLTSKDYITNLPKCKNNSIRLFSSLLENVYPAFQNFGNPKLTSVILLAINLTLQYGLFPFSTIAFSTYAKILVEHFERYKKANYYSKIIPLWNQKISQTQELITQNNLILSTSIDFVFNPISLIIKNLKNNYNQEDKVLAKHNNTLIFHTQYFLSLLTGVRLEELEQSKTDFYNQPQASQNRSQQQNRNHITPFIQVAKNLNDQNKKNTSYQGSIIAYEEQYLKQIDDLNCDVKIIYHFSKCYYYFLVGEYQKAYDSLLILDEYDQRNQTKNLLIRNYTIFYSTLIRIKQYPTLELPIKKEALKKIIKGVNYFNKLSKYYGPNFSPKHSLILAEYYSIIDIDSNKASEYYINAISELQKGSTINELAMAYELQYLHSARTGNNDERLLRKSFNLYAEWQAYNKVNLLKANYPSLSKYIEETPNGINERDEFKSTEFITLQKSLQELFKVTELKPLKEKTLSILVKHTLADKAILILNRNNDWYFEKSTEKNEKLKSHLLKSNTSTYPFSLINYVIRSKKHLSNINKGINNLPNDEYINKNNPSSYLLIPLIHQEKINGVIYLENNSVQNAFKNNQLKLIQVIIGQIIIALQNAELVENLKKEIEHRTEVQHKKFELEKQLFQSKKMETIGTLAGGIAHDFKNLLNPILGFTQLALDNLVQNNYKEAQEDIERVLKGAQRATELVNQIASVSRKSDTQFENFDLKKLFDETFQFIRASIPSNISIDSDVKCNHAFINGNPVQIQQILLNLFTNAFHAIDTPVGSIYFKMKEIKPNQIEYNFIPLEPNQNWLLLQVSDTGKGITESMLQKIFDPFFTTKKVGKGTGLGLSVVHNLIKNHNGHIHVTSKLKSGTNFYIYLPITTEKTIIKKVHKISTINGKGLTAILVDDEEMSLMLIDRLVQKMGFDTHTFSNPLLAKDYIINNNQKVSIIISDQNMPELTGVEMAKKIADEGLNIPLLLNTGDDNYAHTGDTLPGVSETISKPITFDKLNEKVNSILSKSIPLKNDD